MTFFIALMVPVRRRGVGVAMAAFSDLPTITTTMRRTGPAFLRSLSRRTATTDTAATDSLAEFRNKNNLDDQVFSAISGDGGIKVTVATVRNMVNDMMIMQTLAPVPGDAIGRLVACSLLMSNGMQDEQITMNGDGPLRGVMVISTGLGEVKGYVGSPGIGDMPLTEAIGKGSVQVVKNHPEWPNPYNGITAIQNGDIDRDVGE